MAMLEKAALRFGKRPALIVVDASMGFTDPTSPLGSEADSVVEAIGALLRAFRERRLPVYFTTVVYGDSARASVFREKLPVLNELKPGSRLVDIDPRIAPQPGEPVIEKQFPSAFFQTDLAERLAGEGVDTVVITGLTTSGCVRASAVDALSHDLRLIVPREAVGDRDPPAHEANLHDIDAKYGEVVALDAALAMLDELPR